MDAYNLISGKKYQYQVDYFITYTHSEIMSFGKIYRFIDNKGNPFNLSESEVKKHIVKINN